jgi:hypothetical protein
MTMEEKESIGSSESNRTTRIRRFCGVLSDGMAVADENKGGF